MGVVKPTGASHKAEISQYLCGFSISVYSFYRPSAQKQQQKKTFVIHEIVTASFFLSVFLPLCGGGGRSAGGCASLNPLIINALVDIWYHISTSFPLKRHPLGKKKNNLNMKPEVRSVLLTHLTHPFTAVLAKETQEACDL